MENNKDNRQLTVIAAEIERHKILKKQYETGKAEDSIMLIHIDGIIRVLESLLAKEESMIIDAFDNGQANYSLPRDVDDGKQYFNETFKTHEHEKQRRDTYILPSAFPSYE